MTTPQREMPAPARRRRAVGTKQAGGGGGGGGTRRQLTVTPKRTADARGQRTAATLTALAVSPDKNGSLLLPHDMMHGNLSDGNNDGGGSGGGENEDGNVKRAANGKHGQVFLITDVHSRVVFALKRQPITDADSLLDKAYRETIVSLNLSRLQDRGWCHAYTYLEAWYKCRGSQCDYMNLLLEYSNVGTLYANNSMPLRRYRAVVLQLLFGLYVAQNELEFMHNDLHLRNVLLSHMPAGKRGMLLRWSGGGSGSGTARQYRLRTDVLVKICDFGLSRVRLDGTVYYNARDIVRGDYFDRRADVHALAVGLKRLRVTDWHTYADSAALKRQQYDLRKRMLAGSPLSSLLTHAFFDVFRDDEYGSDGGGDDEGDAYIVCNYTRPAVPSPVRARSAVTRASRRRFKATARAAQQQQSPAAPKSSRLIRTYPAAAASTPEKVEKNLAVKKKTGKKKVAVPQKQKQKQKPGAAVKTQSTARAARPVRSTRRTRATKRE